MKTFFLGAVALLMACGSIAQTNVYNGYWLGRLNANAFPVDIMLHVSAEDGNLSCTIDIPGQFDDYTADTSWVINDSLAFKWYISQTIFKGIATSPDRIEGTWTTRGNATPIVFDRSADGVYRRPQEPRETPYISQDVTFESKADKHVVLAGTLTVPADRETYPVAILVSGSGPQDRDEYMNGHRPFLVLADRLTKAGIAVLRFDDRGTGESTGSFEGSTTADFAGDVSGAVEFLRNGDLPLSAIGIVGHTEGGAAGMIAATEEDISFLVLLATIGIPHQDLLIAQSVSVLKNAGTIEPLIKIDTFYTRQLYENMRTWSPDSPDTATVRTILWNFYDASELVRSRFGDFDVFYTNQLQLMTSPWFHFYATFVPEEYLGKVKCPILAVNGSVDIQSVAEINLSAIDAILATSGHLNDGSRVEKLDGLNHFFQPASGDLAHEYGLIMTTFDEGAMQLISDWILSLK